MGKYIPGNQKHLTLNDRIYIENELSKGATFKDIAAFLSVRISKRNGAADLIRRLMYVMAVQ